MRLAVAVGFAFALWAGFLAVALTGRASLDVLAVLLLIGLLVIRETTGRSAPRALNARVGVFVFIGVLAFVLVVVQRVRDVLG